MVTFGSSFVVVATFVFVFCFLVDKTNRMIESMFTNLPSAILHFWRQFTCSSWGVSLASPSDSKLSYRNWSYISNTIGNRDLYCLRHLQCFVQWPDDCWEYSLRTPLINESFNYIACKALDRILLIIVWFLKSYCL